MSNKIFVTVVRDIVAEKTGIYSSVGEKVEVVKMIPRFKPVTVHFPGKSEPLMFPTNKDVYLVEAALSRFMSGSSRVGGARITYCGYEGNDIYSAEELGL